METINKRLSFSFFSKLMFTLFSLFLSVFAIAQDTKAVDVNVSTDSGGSGFFGSPIMWIIGAAVFILLLVAILRGGSKRSDV